MAGPDGLFATGSARYFDAEPGRKEPLPRVYVRIRIDGSLAQFLALLDTGGHFCILGPPVARLVEHQLVEGLGAGVLMTSQGRIHGELFQHRIELVADTGKTLGLEATVLVSPDWRGPTVLGYSGCVERMRVTLDPQRNLVYHGPLA